MTEIETMLPPAVPPADPVTVKVALALAGPLYAVPPAVIVVVPGPTAVATPEALMVATEGTLEFHVTELVISPVVACFALPKVPIALNCAVCPTATD
jgi:hypothetical protein